MSADMVALARELEASDLQLAAEIEALVDLERRASTIAERAAELGAFERSLPFERVRLAEALDQGRAELARKEQEHEEAERRLAAAHGDALSEARRAAVRAGDAASVARHRVERQETESAQLEARAASLAGGTRELALEAAEVTAAIREAPAISHGTVLDPSPDPAALVEWGSRARAALLVGRSGLETRRERVVREAYELEAAVLGEQISSSATGVRERLERDIRARAR
jgi:hypothetical protein